MDPSQVPPTNEMNALALSSSQTWGLTTKKNWKGEERSPSERLQDLGIPIASTWQEQLRDQLGFVCLLLVESDFFVTIDVLTNTIRAKPGLWAFRNRVPDQIEAWIRTAEAEFNKENHGDFQKFKLPSNGVELIEKLVGTISIIQERLQAVNINWVLQQFFTALELQNKHYKMEHWPNRAATLYQLRKRNGIPAVWPPQEGGGMILQGVIFKDVTDKAAYIASYFKRYRKE